jgi:uncharacterized YigZ family protein
MSTDHYRTIAARVEYSLKVERSEFLGIAFPVANEEEFFAQLAQAEKKHFDATHHCWAFRLFAEGESRQRSSDAGEPAGTAGKPIQSAIEGARLHDVGVIVVRWFGGVKLGTGGLSRAYRAAAAETLERTQPVDRYQYDRIDAVVPFDMLSVAYRLVKPPDVILAAERFGEENVFSFDVRRSMAQRFRLELAEKRLLTPR